MPAFPDPETYRDILNGLQIGVSVVDLQKKIVFWSDGAEQITGYARIDVLGHSCAENILLHCNQIGCEMCTGKCPMATALHAARPVEAMSFIHHKSGHRTPVHSWAIPLRNKQGSIIGIIIGTALLQILRNLVNLLGIDSSLDFAVMGVVLLIGVLADQLFQKHSGSKKAA